MQGVPFSILYRYHHFNDVQIYFQMEVTAAESSKETNNSEATTSSSSSFKFGCFAKGPVTVNGKVSSSCENTHSTSYTAKYQIHVSISWRYYD